MIIFNYKIEDFLNNAQVLSLYRSNSLLEKGSEHIVDDTAVSDEDETLLKKYLKAGASFIAQVISGYTKDLINSAGDTVPMEGEPFKFDVTYETVEHSIVFRLNMPETFNLSVLSTMDEAIKDTLENYVLWRVNEIKGTESASWKDSYETALGQVRNYINRRTQGTRRNYNLI